MFCTGSMCLQTVIYFIRFVLRLVGFATPWDWHFLVGIWQGSLYAGSKLLNLLLTWYHNLPFPCFCLFFRNNRSWWTVCINSRTVHTRILQNKQRSFYCYWKVSWAYDYDSDLHPGEIALGMLWSSVLQSQYPLTWNLPLKGALSST